MGPKKKSGGKKKGGKKGKKKEPDYQTDDPFLFDHFGLHVRDIVRTPLGARHAACLLASPAVGLARHPTTVCRVGWCGLLPLLGVVNCRRLSPHQRRNGRRSAGGEDSRQGESVHLAVMAPVLPLTCYRCAGLMCVRLCDCQVHQRVQGANRPEEQRGDVHTWLSKGLGCKACDARPGEREAAGKEV